jgi:hypothetical protein
MVELPDGCHIMLAQEDKNFDVINLYKLNDLYYITGPARHIGCSISAMATRPQLQAEL